MKYDFYTQQFGVDAEGLHLLRSKYKFLPYRDIDSITLKRGKAIRNWLLLLLFGLCCLAFSGYYLFTLYALSSPQEAYIVPVISAFIGFGAIVLSLKVRDIMIVRTRKKKVVLLMKQLVQEHKTDAFITFISQRLGYRKVFVNPDFDKENTATPVSRKSEV